MPVLESYMLHGPCMSYFRSTQEYLSGEINPMISTPQMWQKVAINMYPCTIKMSEHFTQPWAQRIAQSTEIPLQTMI